MANALWEQRRDREYARAIAAGDRYAEDVAETERRGWVRDLRARAEANVASGYMYMGEVQWVVYDLTAPDPGATTDDLAAGLVIRGTITYWRGQMGAEFRYFVDPGALVGYDSLDEAVAHIRTTA
jgi:hypothetical protein